MRHRAVRTCMDEKFPGHKRKKRCRNLQHIWQQCLVDREARHRVTVLVKETSSLVALVLKETCMVAFERRDDNEFWHRSVLLPG